MTLTLLIDLDDTLLGNDMEVFLPAYLQALGKHLSATVPPDKLIGSLMAATEVMMVNDQPDATLKQTFDGHFFPQLGLQAEGIQDEINDFYENVFPSLQPLTQLRPKAVALVEGAFERGYEVAVATNPLFPKTAIDQRLDWAGLSPGKYPFTVVSSYESFHFAKPNPAYLAEILAQSGWQNSQIVMIGNDWDADIIPAQQFGIASYYVTKNSGRETAYTGQPAHNAGCLDGIFPWVDSLDPEALKATFNSPAAITAILKSTPAALSSLLSAYPPGDWHQRPGPDEWGLIEILCHLRDVDNEVHLPRLESFKGDGNPYIEAVDADSWAEVRQYAEQDGKQALEEFLKFRMKLIEMLCALSAEDWDQPARHTMLGPTSLQELLRISSRHDRLHIAQIHKLLFA